MGLEMELRLRNGLMVSLELSMGLVLWLGLIEDGLGLGNGIVLEMSWMLPEKLRLEVGVDMRLGTEMVVGNRLGMEVTLALKVRLKLGLEVGLLMGLLVDLVVEQALGQPSLRIPLKSLSHPFPSALGGERRQREALLGGERRQREVLLRGERRQGLALLRG